MTTIDSCEIKEMGILFNDQDENFMGHVCRHFFNLFEIFYFDSFTVYRFFSLETVNRDTQLFLLIFFHRSHLSADLRRLFRKNKKNEKTAKPKKTILFMFFIFFDSF